MRTIPRAADLLTSGLFTGGLLTTCDLENIGPASTANASLSCAEPDGKGVEAPVLEPGEIRRHGITMAISESALATAQPCRRWGP